MSFGKQIATEVAEAKAVLDRVRVSLQDKIKALPDNPKIKRMPGNPRAMVVSFKDIGKNWSVAHHDFKQQYEMLVQELDRGDSIGTLEKLRGIIESRVIRDRSGSLTLHPVVVENLVKMMEAA